MFFAANLLVFFGFWTRTAMAVLAGTLLLGGGGVGDRVLIALAGIAALSVLLPIGRYVSLDRYLQLAERPSPYEPVEPARSIPLGRWWQVAFVVATALLVGPPTYNQLLHHDNRFLVSWHMFNRVGRDLLAVRFFHQQGEARQDVDYRPLLGARIQRIGMFANRKFPDMRIVGIPHLNRVIALVCQADHDPAALRLDAKLASLVNGWVPLYDGSRPICTADGAPLLITFPPIHTGIPGSFEDTAGGAGVGEDVDG